MKRYIEPRVTVVLGEAFRNALSGTSRAVVFGFLFVIFVGLSAIAQVNGVTDFVAKATAFLKSGAAIQILSSPYGIDGAQCDALSSHPAVVSSGALREGSDVSLAVLPSTPIQNLEITPGFVAVLDWEGVRGFASPGVWVSSDLGDAIGAMTGESELPLVGNETVKIVGSYQWPNDGRNPRLAFHILSPVSLNETFDECWIVAWPDPEAASNIWALPAIQGTISLDGRPDPPQISQANTTLGTHFEGEASFAGLPMTALRWFAIVTAALIGFVSIRIRRLELASVLHSGWPRKSIILQITAETTVWVSAAILPSSAVCYALALRAGTANWYASFFPGVQTIIEAGIVAVISAIIAVFCTRENHLFRYFKNR